MKKYKILIDTSASGLANQVQTHIEDGWELRGSHQVVETHRQNRFAGTQHKDTTIRVEYSQTIIKE